jgi:hypothetical protein
MRIRTTTARAGYSASYEAGATKADGGVSTKLAGRGKHAVPSRRVDDTPPGPLKFAAPVADWIAFLARQLAAEFLQEIHEKDSF